MLESFTNKIESQGLPGKWRHKKVPAKLSAPVHSGTVPRWRSCCGQSNPLRRGAAAGTPLCPGDGHQVTAGTQRFPQRRRSGPVTFPAKRSPLLSGHHPFPPHRRARGQPEAGAPGAGRSGHPAAAGGGLPPRAWAPAKGRGSSAGLRYRPGRARPWGAAAVPDPAPRFAHAASTGPAGGGEKEGGTGRGGGGEEGGAGSLRAAEGGRAALRPSAGGPQRAGANFRAEPERRSAEPGMG